MGTASLENQLINESGLSTNNRITNRAKLLGYLKGNVRSRELLKFTKSRSCYELRWRDIQKYQHILEEQFQKLCFHGPQNSDTNKHGNTQNRKKVSEIFRFYIMYLYKILLEIGKRTQSYNISITEFNAFVVTSSNHFDFIDKVKLIIKLRNEEESNRKEIEKWFKEIAKGNGEKGSELDTRITNFLELSPNLIIDKENISIKRESISEIYYLVHNFETMLENGEITLFSEDPIGYEEMLCSLGTPWQKN